MTHITNPHWTFKLFFILQPVPWKYLQYICFANSQMAIDVNRCIRMKHIYAKFQSHKSFSPEISASAKKLMSEIACEITQPHEQKHGKLLEQITALRHPGNTMCQTVRAVWNILFGWGSTSGSRDRPDVTWLSDILLLMSASISAWSWLFSCALLGDETAPGPINK